MEAGLVRAIRLLLRNALRGNMLLADGLRRACRQHGWTPASAVPVVFPAVVILEKMYLVRFTAGPHQLLCRRSTVRYVMTVFEKGLLRDTHLCPSSQLAAHTTSGFLAKKKFSAFFPFISAFG